MPSVLVIKDAKWEDVSTPATGRDCAAQARSVRCWTTRQCVSAHQDAHQVSPFVSRTEAVLVTWPASTSNAAIPVKERSAPATHPVLWRTIKLSANFVLLDLRLMPIMDVSKVITGMRTKIL